MMALPPRNSAHSQLHLLTPCLALQLLQLERYLHVLVVPLLQLQSMATLSSPFRNGHRC